MNKLIIALVLLVALVAMLFIGEAKGEYHYKGELALATEYPAPGEADSTRKIIADLEAVLSELYPAPKRTLRDAHITQHGLVKAEFIVREDIDERYRVGVFTEPKTFKAWIRFSNNFDKPDFEKNTRGMAIKLMGVEGPKLLTREQDANTQDFILMNSLDFPTKNAISFGELLSALKDGKPSLFRYLLTHPRTAKRFMQAETRTADLFAIIWGSVTPYKLGDGLAVKYIAKSRDASQETMPGKDASPTFLRERLVARLAREDVLLDFYIQPQIDAKAMPIEDARVLWSEDLSPHIKVATIRILKQNFDTPAQHLYGDQLSFTPWHASSVHQPLGGINRARKDIYEAISKFRHERNGEVRTEPEDWGPFEGE